MNLDGLVLIIAIVNFIIIITAWTINFLKNYSLRKNTTLIFASHNMSEVDKLCDEVILMRSGKIIKKGTPQGIKNFYEKDNLQEKN